MTREQAALVERAKSWARLTVARYYGPSHPLYEDAAQSALLKLAEVVDRWDPERSSWRTYAIMVMRCAVSDFGSYHSRRETVQGEELDDPADAYLGPELDADKVLSSPELPRLYRRALKAGGRAAPLGLPKRAADKVIECSRTRLQRILDDRP